MSVQVSITAPTTAGVIRTFDAIPDTAERAIRAVVAAAALEVEGEAKESIQRGPKTGRKYRTRNKKILHQASAPGEAPATDTGTLVSRIFTESLDNGFVASVFSDVDYALYLEEGTRKMAARPFLKPALDKAEPEFLRNLEDAISGALVVP